MVVKSTWSRLDNQGVVFSWAPVSAGFQLGLARSKEAAALLLASSGHSCHGSSVHALP